MGVFLSINCILSHITAPYSYLSLNYLVLPYLAPVTGDRNKHIRKKLYLSRRIYTWTRSLLMESRHVVDNVVLWLSLLSIAVICLLMLYYGVTGIASLLESQASPMKQAFSLSVYFLFIILPLLILNLMLDTAFINEIFEWSVTLIYIAIVVDIILMTIFYLLM